MSVVRTVNWPPGLAEWLWQIALVASSYLTELAGLFPQVSGHDAVFMVRDTGGGLGYVPLACWRPGMPGETLWGWLCHSMAP